MKMTPLGGRGDSPARGRKVHVVEVFRLVEAVVVAVEAEPVVGAVEGRVVLLPLQGLLDLGLVARLGRLADLGGLGEGLLGLRGAGGAGLALLVVLGRCRVGNGGARQGVVEVVPEGDGGELAEAAG